MAHPLPHRPITSPVRRTTRSTRRFTTLPCGLPGRMETAPSPGTRGCPSGRCRPLLPRRRCPLHPPNGLRIRLSFVGRPPRRSNRRATRMSLSCNKIERSPWLGSRTLTSARPAAEQLPFGFPGGLASWRATGERRNAGGSGPALTRQTKNGRVARGSPGGVIWSCLLATQEELSVGKDSPSKPSCRDRNGRFKGTRHCSHGS